LESIARDEGVMQALIEKSGLLVMHGNFESCYTPLREDIRLSRREAFNASGPAGHLAWHSMRRAIRHRATSALFGDAVGERFEDEGASSANLLVDPGVRDGRADEPSKHLEPRGLPKLLGGGDRE
jgi:hypothetical protein